MQGRIRVGEHEVRPYTPELPECIAHNVLNPVYIFTECGESKIRP